MPPKKRKKRVPRSVGAKATQFVQTCPLIKCSAKGRCYQPSNCWGDPNSDPSAPLNVRERRDTTQSDLEFLESLQGLEDDEYTA